MTLQQLRTLIAVVRFGSFRRAARELGVSQPGLTTSLQGLEDVLQAQLIVRSPHGIALTEQGREVYERALLIDREAARISEDIERSRGIQAGTLSVGFGPTPTALILGKVVPDFQARFPQVRLRLTSGIYEHLEPALMQGRIEVAVTVIPVDGVAPGLIGIPLYHSDLVVIAREGHPRQHATTLPELEHDEWVLMGTPGGPGGSIGKFHADQGLPTPRAAVTCESLTQVATLVRTTDWLAMVPAVVVEGGLLGPGLRVLPLREPPPLFENCVVYRRDIALTPAAQAFAAMCESCSRALALGRRKVPAASP